MTLSELGAKLRQAREQREMALYDVVDHLKIPLRILKGLEEGSELVPRTVYVRHFIKEYARLLGFAEEEINLWLKDLEGFEQSAFSPVEHSAPYTSVKPSILPALFSLLFKLLLLGLLAFGAYEAYVYFFASRTSESVSLPAPAPTGQSASPWGSTSAPEAPSAPAVTQAEPAAEPAHPKTPATAEPPASEAPAAAEISAAPESPAPAAEPTPPVESTESGAQTASGEQTVSEASAAAEPAPEVSPPEPATLPEGLHQVEVSAVDGDCWMGFESDGKQQQRTLRRGDTFSMSFRDSLVIRLGNIKAVRISYDGEELPRRSSVRVVTMTFPPQP